jgi:hypothetical protein
MSRTFAPKYASYMGDGSGRDTYVVLNNGGLSNNEKRAMMWRPNKVPLPANPRPFKAAPALKYQSDGTGRDSYVVSNSGGLVADFRCSKPDMHFIGGLRVHHLSPVRHANDRWRGPDGTDYLNWYTPKDQRAVRLAVSKQRELTDRLSPHKGVSRLSSEYPGPVGRLNSTLDHFSVTEKQNRHSRDMSQPRSGKVGNASLMKLRQHQRKPFIVSNNL